MMRNKEEVAHEAMMKVADGLATRKDIQKLQNWDGNTVQEAGAAEAAVARRVVQAAPEEECVHAAMMTIIVAVAEPGDGSEIPKDIPKPAGEDAAAVQDVDAAAEWTMNTMRMTTAVADGLETRKDIRKPAEEVGVSVQDADAAGWMMNMMRMMTVVMDVVDGSEIRRDIRKPAAEVGEVQDVAGGWTMNTMSMKATTMRKKIMNLNHQDVVQEEAEAAHRADANCNRQ
jgi:hypothetical protein